MEGILILVILLLASCLRIMLWQLRRVRRQRDMYMQAYYGGTIPDEPTVSRPTRYPQMGIVR